MTKEEIDFVLKDNSYLENGTKQACVKIQDFLKHIKSIESSSSINNKEFLESVNILLAFTFASKDTVPNKWHCECDCRHSGSLLCPGEFNTDKSSHKLCPYYRQEDF